MAGSHPTGVKRALDDGWRCMGYNLDMEGTDLEYRIDASDVLTEVGGNWTAFAEENKAAELAPGAVIGRPIWDFIRGRETRHIYRLILIEARASLSVFRFPFRCDSPGLKRFHEMEILPEADGALRFCCRTLRTEARQPAMLLERDMDRSGEYVTVCSWCRRIRMPGGEWAGIDVAVTRLDIFGSERQPSITHGICPDDHEMVMREIERSRRNRRKAA